MDVDLFSLSLSGLAAITYLGHRWIDRATPYRRTYTVYRHWKTGTEYAILFEGRLEQDARPCVIYAPVDELDCPTPWVRDYNEFFDGRFVEVGTITHQL